MNSIHIADSQGRKQSYDPQEARRLWNEEAIPRNSLYWQEGMTEWRPAVEYFAAPPASTLPDTLPPVISNAVTGGLAKDPTRLTRFLIVMLWIYLGLAGLATLTAVILLATGQAGKSETDEFTQADMITLLVSLPQMLVHLITSVVFLMWIHRANYNARGLGARDMRFTPGWAVGWYFIPIATLWKPYQAMKEIWRASANPNSWQSQEPPPLLSTWWTLWIINTVLSNMSLRASMRSGTQSGMLASTVVDLISDLFTIPLCLVAIRLVREIIRLQTHWAAQAAQTASSSCGICRQPKAPADLIYLNRTWVCAQCKPIVVQQIQERGIEQ